MHIIVCLDDKGGMMFNNRRQSKDSVLRERVIEIAAGTRLMMNEYSFRQFSEDAVVTVDENPLSNAKDNDVCFIENLPTAQFKDKISKITVFKWNRVYPSDMFFDIDTENGWRLAETREFEGSSHQKITEEVYVK